MKNVLKSFGKEVLERTIKNRPMIATIAAIGSLGLMGFLMYKEAPKIKEIKENHVIKVDEIKNDEELTEEEKKEALAEARVETAKEALIPIGKIAGSVVLTIALILSINKAHNLRTEALIAAYEVSKGKVMGYESVLPDIVGPRKAEEVKTQVAAEVANEQAKRNGYSTVVMNDDTKCLCRDVFGNQWCGTYNDIEEAKNRLNEYIITDNCDATLNDFYDFLPGCNRTVIGDDMIFNRENGAVDIRYSTTMDELTHKPMIVIDYHTAPKCTNKRYACTKEEITEKWRYGT